MEVLLNMKDLDFKKWFNLSFAPGFICSYTGYDGELMRAGAGGGPRIKMGKQRSYYSRELKCKNCGAYGKGITFYNHEDYKLCKNCFLEMKKKQREEQGE